ncbi:unnamed protein product, partial [Amoebophrya sp. A25]|eukprot:GSA25T00022158001.1
MIKRSADDGRLYFVLKLRITLENMRTFGKDAASVEKANEELVVVSGSHLQGAQAEPEHIEEQDDVVEAEDYRRVDKTPGTPRSDVVDEANCSRWRPRRYILLSKLTRPE